ncbi:hypothetical protein [Streptomyces sp. NPDC002054]|uniref:hypothetical protein n=1 Tax=Streptomyces sp. NPDC002054 TaxID=3154663 RepID=UPI00332E6ADC
MNATPPPQPTAGPYAPAGAGTPWFLLPLLFTLLALLGGAYTYRSSILSGGPLWLLLPYALPLGLLAGSWIPPRTPEGRVRSIALGGAGSFIALVYAHAASALLFTLAIAAWLVQGD